VQYREFSPCNPRRNANCPDPQQKEKKVLLIDNKVVERVLNMSDCIA
jgi:hypothetical protein